jgi:type VI secretion system protein ImpL
VLQPAYQRELETVLLPRVAQMVEGQIRSNLKNRERLLNSLRAYLMLGLPERRDQAWLKDWVAAGWSQRYTGNTAAQDSLNTTWAPARAIVRLPAQRRPGGSGPPGAARRIAGQRGVPRAARAGPQPARNTVSASSSGRRPRSSSAPTTRSPASTPPGLPAVLLGAGRQPGQRHPARQLGAGRGQRHQRHGHASPDGELEQLYFRDYANYWGEAVNQVGLIPFSDAGEGADQLSALTAANSPLLLLLTEVRENTRFPVLAEATDEAGRRSRRQQGRGQEARQGWRGRGRCRGRQGPRRPGQEAAAGHRAHGPATALRAAAPFAR